MARMAKSAKNYAMVSLIMRILAAILLALSIALLVTNTFKFIDLNGERNTASFKDVYAFRYLLAGSAIGLLYNVLQIVPAIFLIVTRKFLLPHPFGLYLDFIADQVIGYLLASSGSAALAVSMEFKRILDDSGVTEFDRFYLKVEASAALTLVAALTMIVLSIISARFLFKN